ncbi:MAG: preprotein translocase subunit SecY [Flavobacteriales bacterium]|nr:preprotein translocase subunit SecY [Flavobacteriales bacterium]
MKRFVETLKNIWNIEELRKRILYTLALLLIYRVGAFVVLPGIDSGKLAAANADAGGWAELINLFAGGAFTRASVLALGIMPYITASIFMQLAGIAVPSLAKMQREGESGRRKFNQITRLLTVVVTFFQGITYLNSPLVPHEALIDPNAGFWGFTLPSVIILVTGTLFAMWLGERITDNGLGNGVSLLIMVGIIASFPTAMVFEFQTRLDGSGGPLMFLLEIAFLLLVILLSVLLVQGTRKVPVQYAKRIVGNKQYGGVRQYLPLKVNAAGVMPIIFASAIMQIPALFSGVEGATGFVVALSNPFGFWYNCVLAIFIILFTYFYTAITFSPQQLAEEMKRNGGFIPGIKPGKKTAEYIDNIISRITLPGSFFLAFVSILPAFAYQFGVTNSFALFFGGTSLLIMVGVILDTLQQIESHLLMRHYDGLMKTGKIKGRSSVSMAAG